MVGTQAITKRRPPTRRPRADAARNREPCWKPPRPCWARAGQTPAWTRWRAPPALAPARSTGTFPRGKPCPKRCTGARWNTWWNCRRNWPTRPIRSWHCAHGWPPTLSSSRPKGHGSGTSELHAYTSDRLTGAVRTLMDRAVAAGSMRSDVGPGDALRLMVALCYSADTPGWQGHVLRLLNVFVDGMCNPPPHSPAPNALAPGPPRP